MTAISIRAAGQVLQRVDRVLLAIVAILLALAAFVPTQALESLGFLAESLVAIAPFIVIAIVIAAWCRAAAADRLIARAFSGRVAPMIVAAALFGSLSPFCSCGVIPLIAALLAMGMPLPAVMAFWLSSPVMDPEMFILTAAGLGLEMAVVKTMAAFAIGLLGGFATLGLVRAGMMADPLSREVSTCADAVLRHPKPPLWAFWREAERRALFMDEARANGFFLLKWLALAFLLESLMLAWVPADAIGAWLGGGNAFAVPAAALAGVPAYLNGYAAIPTTAALIELGMAPGAALAFMVAGAVTSIPAAVAVWALVRRPVFAWYLVLAFTGATAAGLAYQGWLAA